MRSCHVGSTLSSEGARKLCSYERPRTSAATRATSDLLRSGLIGAQIRGFLIDAHATGTEGLGASNAGSYFLLQNGVLFVVMLLSGLVLVVVADFSSRTSHG